MSLTRRRARGRPAKPVTRRRWRQQVARAERLGDRSTRLDGGERPGSSTASTRSGQVVTAQRCVFEDVDERLAELVAVQRPPQTDSSSLVGKPLFDASFRRKGLASLAGLFGMTIRVPDPLFHELGVIITRDTARTRRFIEDDGAQSAVMDLLGEDVAIKVQRSGRIVVSGKRKSDPFDQTAIERELAVLLVHLDRWTEG